jgi:hypothetical protein
MFNTQTLTEVLLDTAAGVWEFAPKQLQAAQASADRAFVEYLDAQSAVEDAEHLLFIAQHDFDNEGRQAVRDGKPLPDGNSKDRARFTLENARLDLAKANSNLRLERGTLASMLNDKDIREAWRISLTSFAEDTKNEIRAVAQTTAPLQANLIKAASLSKFLAEWGSHASLPAVTDVNPASALFALSNMKLWEQPKTFDSTTRWADNTPKAEDTRPAIHVVNEGGGVHLMTAEDAERVLANPGYRPATEAEILNEYRRQGINPPSMVVA